MKKFVPVLVVVLSLLAWTWGDRLPDVRPGIVSAAAAQEGPPNIEGVFGPPGGPGAGLGGLLSLIHI